jgi:anti-sigma factor RsiW
MDVSCEEMNERIHRYLDEELTGNERIEFEAHINECSRCLLQMQGLGFAVQKLTQTEWHKAPIHFTESLLARLDEQFPPKRNWRVSVMKWSGIAASVLLVFGLGAMWATPDHFALQAENNAGLVVTDGKVIVPEGQEYNGDLVIQNGDVEVRGKVNGNVTALNGKVYRAAGADISGEIAEVDEVMEKVFYYGKRLINEAASLAR